MKKTTYALIILLALIIIGETIFILALKSTGKERERYNNPAITEKSETVEMSIQHKDKIEVTGGDEEINIWLPANTTSEGISLDSIYSTDTLIIISAGAPIIVY